MAHLAKHLSQPAIFSPSVARAAASTAKDWSYIDGWLKAKFQGQKVPPFERNADTLKALLALAVHNEAADEERDQAASMEAAALEQVQSAEAETVKRREAYEAAAQDGPLDGGLIADDIVQAIEDGLTRDGRAALDTMAGMAIELGMAHPSPEELGCKFVELQGRAFELEQTVQRVALLQKYLDRESATVESFVHELEGDEFQPPADLAKQNLELQRQVKSMSAELPELQQQVAARESSAAGLPTLTVEEVRKDEEDYLDLLAKKKDFDARVKAFAGLPPDIEAARVELEALREELRTATQRRDAGWEGLVERESPFKPRSRRPM